jgi:hypothetical protein
MVKLILGTLVSIILYFSFQTEKHDIVRMESTIFEDEVYNTIAYPIDFKDTIPNDTLFADFSQNGTPLKYWRKILTEVCIDGECRKVQIDLFWNITGHYLGFRMPNGEFLSKTEHDPFNAAEYDRMHQLLSDPNSALANYSLEELVSESDSSKNKVDAVSSATLTAVLDYIVEGAVYTTYSLWQITYGSTKREAENLTIQKLDSDLVLKILNKGEIKDKIWVLNRIPKTMDVSPKLITKLLDLVSGDDIYLAERSLNAISSAELSNKVQSKLAVMFSNTGFLQKRLILNKLKEAPQLNKEIIHSLTSGINSLNGALVKALFELLKVHNVEDEALTKQISPLLKNDNRYIANQAYQFLADITNLDKKTLNELERYKRRMQ